MKNKIKLYIIPFTLVLFFSIFFNCGAAYSEANLEASELDASTTEQINNFYNKLEDGKLGADLDGVSDDQSQESSFNFEDYFDYTKIHFWILLVSVVLIFLILINLFKQLGEMKSQMDEYRQKVTSSNTSEDVYQTSEEEIEDEDVESEEEDDFEKEEIEENIIHPHLHIEVESDDDVVEDFYDKDEDNEDVLIDDDNDEDEEVVPENKIDLKETIETDEDESAKELKELESDDDEEILYN